MQRLLILLSIAATLTFQVHGQSGKRKKSKAEPTQESQGPTTLDPFYQPKTDAPKREKTKRGKGPTYDSQKEFEDRMQARGKTNRRNERLLDKPQYSDPSYFGHKRPPKKRPPGKMKFCKQCGLRH